MASAEFGGVWGLNVGAGTTILGAANTYTGGTTLATGTLIAGNNGALGTGALTVTSSATLDNQPGATSLANAIALNPAANLTVAGSNPLTLAGVISGAGSLTKTGAATTILTGANTYAGGTTISAGTLQIGNGGATGSLGTGPVLDNAALVFNRSGTVTVAGAITGTGGLTQNGAAGGSLILTGTNTYSGGTTISAGTLQIGNGGATGSIVGNVADNGILAFDRTGTATMPGVISGAGSVRQIGTGTTILTGTDTYTGGTTITAGTLQLGNGGATGSIVGNVADGGILAFDRTGAATMAGVISGAGSVTQVGTGTTILTGANTYTGGTTISAGALQLGNGGATGSIVGNVTDNGALAFDRTGTATMAGVISGVGSVTQAGPGTTILTANNSYSGGTTISAGTLQVGAGGATGSVGTGPVVDNSALVFNRSGAVTVPGAITGAGSLTQNGGAGGSLILTGTNTYTGGTTISAGTLQIGNGGPTGSIVGNVTDNGILAFDRTGTATMPGVISGTGAVTQIGTGTTILTGTNTYTGGTTIGAGTLQLGNGGATGSIVGNVADNGVLAFNLSAASTVAGLISGAGAVTQIGPGTTILTANNTYAGGTTIAGGALQVGDGGATGSLGTGPVVDNSALIFNRSGAVTVPGAITGTGSLTQNSVAGGSLVLTGANTYAGATTINSGTLEIGAGGSITNQNTLTNFSILDVDPGGAVTVATIVNTATGSIFNLGSIASALNNDGTFENETGEGGGGVWTGDLLSNTGTIVNAATWNATNFFNAAGGTFISTGTLIATTALNNAGALNVQGTLTAPLINNNGAFTVTGPLAGTIGLINNAGSLVVDAGGSLTAGGINNDPSGSITNFGTITDVLNNSGVVVNNGAYNADVNNFTTGVITNNGVWTGDLLSNAGSVVNNGTWNAANFNNSPGGMVVTSGSLTATTAINNAGLFDASGSVTTPLINNSGVFSATKGPLGGVIGVFNNSGVLTLVNGQTNDTFSATTYNGQGGVFAVDVNAAASASTQRSDVLKVTNLSGSTSLLINPVGPAGLLSSPIPVIVAMNVAAGTTVTIANPPGIINYTLQQSGGTFNLVSSINTSAVSATPAGINAVVTALNTGFFQNSSAFISEPENPAKNQWNGGPWIRVAQGQNDVDSVTVAQNPTGAGEEPAKVRAAFDGFQTGVDLGVANVAGLGWNTHFGLTAGQISVHTNDLLTTTITSQTQVPYLGLYGAVTGHNFFADFELREDFYQLKLTNPAAMLNNVGLYGAELAASASVGYRLNLPSSWFIEPSAAFIYSDLHMNALRINLDQAGTSAGYLVLNPFLSTLGRAGLRVGTTYVFDNIGLALQPFVTGSMWREFAGDSTSSFVLPATSVPLSVTRVGTFGQVGLGVSAQLLNTPALGYLRGDYRVGENVSGYAVVAGVRFQF